MLVFWFLYILTQIPQSVQLTIEMIQCVISNFGVWKPEVPIIWNPVVQLRSRCYTEIVRMQHMQLQSKRLMNWFMTTPPPWQGSHLCSLHELQVDVTRVTPTVLAIHPVTCPVASGRSSSIIHHPSFIIHHPSSIIHHPSLTVDHPSLIIEHFGVSPGSVAIVST